MEMCLASSPDYVWIEAPGRENKQVFIAAVPGLPLEANAGWEIRMNKGTAEETVPAFREILTIAQYLAGMVFIPAEVHLGKGRGPRIGCGSFRVLDDPATCTEGSEAEGREVGSGRQGPASSSRTLHGPSNCLAWGGLSRSFFPLTRSIIVISTEQLSDGHALGSHEAVALAHDHDLRTCRKDRACVPGNTCRALHHT